MSAIKTAVASAITIALLGAAEQASGQFLTPSAPESGFWVEAMHPNLKTTTVTAASSAWFVGGRLPISERFRVFADVPFAIARYDGSTAFGNETNSVLGNPLLGVEFVATNRVLLEVSTRLPITTADEESFADVVGLLADPHRSEAFLKDYVPVGVAATYEHEVVRSLSLRGRAASTAILYTGDDEESENSTLVDYGLFATYDSGGARLGGGVSGRWDATADDGRFSDNSVHQLGLTLDALMGGVRPGVAVRVPLDSTSRDMTRSTVGLYLQVPLR